MAGRSLVLQTRNSYLPGVGLLVRVEIQGADGKPDRSQWDAAVALSSSNPAVTLSASQVILRNGLGSVLVIPSGSGNFTLQASVGGVTTTKALTDLTGQAQTNVSGTLTGGATTWSGIIHVTGNTTVPTGHTLTIQPGTLILIDGNPTPQSQNATMITVPSTRTARSPRRSRSRPPTPPLPGARSSTTAPPLRSITTPTSPAPATRPIRATRAPDRH
jgi:hypothetical protein